MEAIDSFSKLFDVCSCKCFDSGITERNQCSCPLNSKIPPLEWEFWIDQKTSRIMTIGIVDAVETKKLNKSERRKRKAADVIQDSTSEL